MEVGVGNHDMLRSGEDHPARIEPAHDQPIEDEQVNEVEDEQHAEGISEEFPEAVTLQSRGSPEQCEAKGAPMRRPRKKDLRCSSSDLGGTTSWISFG